MSQRRVQAVSSPAGTAGLTAAGLRRIVLRLPERTPIAEAFEDSDRAERARRSVYYRSQREHVERWLAEYNGPGYYGRQNVGGGAKEFYNRFKCAGGLIWLAEAAGVPSEVLLPAVEAVRGAPHNPAAECGAFRKHVPWEIVEHLVNRRCRTLRNLPR